MGRRLLSLGRKRDTAFDFKSELGGYEPPSFPALVTRALDLLSDSEIDMARVAEVIELDPGVSSRMLRLVNSAALAPRSKVTSVHQASMMLGRNQLEALLISVGAGNAIPNPPNSSYQHRRFWATAAKRATLASMIAGRVDPTRRSENFTAALLQDMAIPVLVLRAEPYSAVLDYWHNTNEDLTNLEVSSFGWHHGDVASWMGSNWGFPDEFVQCMVDHHEGTIGNLLPAHVVSPIRETDTDGDLIVIENGASILGLATDDIVTMISDAEVEAEALANLLT
jgi:HD-like signal output (HDOD) protein